jgi:flagellar biosynthesis protein FlhF
MQLRRFTAATMAEAMALVRRALGDEAVILATDTAPDGATVVTAALDAPHEPWKAETAATLPDGTRLDCAETVQEAVAGHGLPSRLAETLLAAALGSGTDDPHDALAGALEACIAFAPLGDAAPEKPLMLVGAPGAGKTLTAAKLATRAVLARLPVRVLTTDLMRAGAVEQLAAFTRILQVPLETIDSERQLTLALAGRDPAQLVIVDTAGINPYLAGDRDALAGLIGAAAAEPVLVLPAGGDLFDAVDTADIFHDLGCRRLIATRVDMARRLGSFLAVAEGSRLALAEAGIGPSVAEGLVPLGPDTLARLLLPAEEAAGPVTELVSR